MGNEQDIFQMYGRTYQPEQVICREGDPGAEMFIIQSGQVRISKRAKDTEKTLVILQAGDFFGEMSVIDGLPRVASVVTTAPTRCLALASWEFEQLVLDHPTIALAILRGLSARLRSKTEPRQH